MAYVDSEPDAHADDDWPADDGSPLGFKLLVAGGFGAGKTTMVRSVTEIRSVHTEELMSEDGGQSDEFSGVEDKRTTTVALDFGRITIDDDIVLYLFGVPGQDRFWFMWDELSYGSIGVVILADTRCLADCFHAIDYFELRQIPFAIAVNCFDDAPLFHPEAVRAALDVDLEVPVVLCDARDRTSCRDVLVILVEHARQTVEAADPFAGD